MSYICIKLNIMHMINLLGMPGPTELLLLAFIVLILFGGKKLPELMKGLGQGIKEFNKAKSNIESEVKDSLRESPRPEARANKADWIERKD